MRSTQQIDIVDDYPPFLDNEYSRVASQPDVDSHNNAQLLVDAILDDCLPLSKRYYSQVSSRPDATPIDEAQIVDNTVDCPPLGERYSQVASRDRTSCTSCKDVVSEAVGALKAGP